MEKDTCFLKVLVIEPDSDMLDLFEDVMREVGHDVTKVSRYSSAILEASGGDFDVIIAEVGTPGLMGPEILAWLRRLQPNALIAAMTSFGTERAAQEAFKEGADYYIAKPIQMESLKDFISRLVRDKMKSQAKGGHRISGVGGSEQVQGGASPTRKAQKPAFNCRNDT